MSDEEITFTDKEWETLRKSLAVIRTEGRRRASNASAALPDDDDAALQTGINMNLAIRGITEDYVVALARVVDTGILDLEAQEELTNPEHILGVLGFAHGKIQEMSADAANTPGAKERERTLFGANHDARSGVIIISRNIQLVTSMVKKKLGIESSGPENEGPAI